MIASKKIRRKARKKGEEGLLLPEKCSVGVSCLSTSSATYRDVLDFVSINPRHVRELVEIGVKYDDLVTFLQCTLYVRYLRSFLQTVVHDQPATSHPNQRR